MLREVLVQIFCRIHVNTCLWIHSLPSCFSEMLQTLLIVPKNAFITGVNSKTFRSHSPLNTRRRFSVYKASIRRRRRRVDVFRRWNDVVCLLGTTEKYPVLLRLTHPPMQNWWVTLGFWDICYKQMYLQYWKK